MTFLSVLIMGDEQGLHTVREALISYDFNSKSLVPFGKSGETDRAVMVGAMEICPSDSCLEMPISEAVKLVLASRKTKKGKE